MSILDIPLNGTMNDLFTVAISGNSIAKRYRVSYWTKLSDSLSMILTLIFEQKPTYSKLSKIEPAQKWTGWRANSWPVKTTGQIERFVRSGVIVLMTPFPNLLGKPAAYFRVLVKWHTTVSVAQVCLVSGHAHKWAHIPSWNATESHFGTPKGRDLLP